MKIDKEINDWFNKVLLQKPQRIFDDNGKIIELYHLSITRNQMVWINVKDQLPEKDEYVLLYDSSLDLIY